MGVSSCLAGCAIVLINLIFLILGFVFTAVGVVFKFGSKWVSAYVEPILKTITQSLESDLPGGVKIDISGILKEVFDIASSIAIFLLIIGIFFLALSITGMCGVCCSSKFLLTIFCCIAGAMCIAIGGLAIWTMSSNEALVKMIKAPLEKMIKNYKGAGSFEPSTLVFDLLNLFFECCGINNGSDFDSIQWNKYMNFTIQGQYTSIELEYPVSCCKMDSTKRPVDANCTFDATLNNSNFNVGCWSKMTGSYLGYFSYLNFALFGVCGFFVLLLVLGVAVICCDRDNKVRDSV